MGMAEEIVTQPNYEKLCSSILNSSEHIMILDPVMDIIAASKLKEQLIGLVDGAGHWVQQEAAEETNAALLNFLAGLD